jgi:hypothetical protein
MPTKKYVHFFAEKSISKMSISSIYLVLSAEENFTSSLRMIKQDLRELTHTENQIMLIEISTLI